MRLLGLVSYHEVSRSAFWYRQHKNTVSDEGGRHLGERRTERSEDLGEKGKRPIDWF